MKRIFAFLLLLLSASIAGYAQNAGKITGTVSYGDDKAVIHQVSVQIVELKKTAPTDDSGVYVFANIPPGTYRLVTHLEGFADATKTVTVTAGATVTADFQLKLAGINEQVTVTASGTEQSTFEAIESVATVDSTQISSRAAIGLGDVLQNESGVSKRSSGPGASRPVRFGGGVEAPSGRGESFSGIRSV